MNHSRITHQYNEIDNEKTDLAGENKPLFHCHPCRFANLVPPVQALQEIV